MDNQKISDLLYIGQEFECPLPSISYKNIQNNTIKKYLKENNIKKTEINKLRFSTLKTENNKDKIKQLLYLGYKKYDVINYITTSYFILIKRINNNTIKIVSIVEGTKILLLNDFLKFIQYDLDKIPSTMYFTQNGEFFETPIFDNGRVSEKGCLLSTNETRLHPRWKCEKKYGMCYRLSIQGIYFIHSLNILQFRNKNLYITKKISKDCLPKKAVENRHFINKIYNIPVRINILNYLVDNINN